MGETDPPIKVGETEEGAPREVAKVVTKEKEYKRQQNYALLRHTDMTEDMLQDAIELCVSGCERFPKNKEGAAKDIKDQMDIRYGRGWSVVVGEGFSFEVTYTINNILYMFFGDLGICVWRCV